MIARASIAPGAGAYIEPVPDDWIRQWGDPVLYETAAQVDAFDDLLARRSHA